MESLRALGFRDRVRLSGDAGAGTETEPVRQHATFAENRDPLPA
jgi:hypothetical protein